MIGLILLSVKTHAVLALALVPYVAAPQSCTHLHYRDTTLCINTDGSGAVFDYGGGTIHEDDFDAAHFTPLYNKLMAEDTAALKARAAQLAALTAQSEAATAAYERAAHAANIRDRKTCLADGDVWDKKTMCHVSEAK